MKKVIGCKDLFQRQVLSTCVQYQSLAPCLDGFTVGVFKECWGILREDVMSTVYNFHQNEILTKLFNATFIALIDKKNGTKEIKDF